LARRVIFAPSRCSRSLPSSPPSAHLQIPPHHTISACTHAATSPNPNLIPVPALAVGEKAGAFECAPVMPSLPTPAPPLACPLVTAAIQSRPREEMWKGESLDPMHRFLRSGNRSHSLLTSAAIFFARSSPCHTHPQRSHTPPTTFRQCSLLPDRPLDQTGKWF
jgi:hypothetical protein